MLDNRFAARTHGSFIKSGVQRGLSPFGFSPRKAKNPIPSVFSGGVYLGKNTSLRKCARVPRKRVRAAGCKPLSFQKMPSGLFYETTVPAACVRVRYTVAMPRIARCRG